MACECKRDYEDADYIELFILPGPDEGFRPGGNTLPKWLMQGTLWQIVMDSIQLFTHIQGVHLLRDREVEWPYKGSFYPVEWTPNNAVRGYGFGVMLDACRWDPKPVVRAPEWALDYMYKILPDNAVTVSIREAPWQEARNSDPPAGVFYEINKAGFTPVVIPDFYAPNIKLDPDYYAMPLRESTVNVCLRKAAYELAKCNLSTMNGPACLMIMSDTPYLYFMDRTSGAAPTVAPKFFEASGFKVGDQWPGAGENQFVIDGDWDSERIAECLKTI